MNKAVAATVEAPGPGDGRAGVVWHTQGPGKSRARLDESFETVTEREEADERERLKNGASNPPVLPASVSGGSDVPDRPSIGMSFSQWENKRSPVMACSSIGTSVNG